MGKIFSIKFGNPFHLVLLEKWGDFRLGDNLNLFRAVFRSFDGLIVPGAFWDDALDKQAAGFE